MKRMARFLFAPLAAASFALIAGCAAESDDEVGETSQAVSPSPNDQAAFEFLVGRGLTDFQAAGVVGNLDAESGMNPRAVQSPGLGRGIAQWSAGGRWDQLVAYAHQRGRSEWDLGLQLEYLWHELETVPAWGLAKLRATGNVVDATIVFQDSFERCGTCHTENRIKYAKAALAAYGGPRVHRASSLSGEGRAEIIAVQQNGEVEAWYNYSGFAHMPWSSSTIVGRGFNDPARVRFADIDGDGKLEIIAIQENGAVQAWHNDRGFTEMPWGESIIIAEGFNDPARVRFADLDGDRRAEIIAIQTNGEIQAWHNGRGFVYMPWDADHIIGQGFNEPARVRLADLDGDGRAELMAIQTNGNIQAWHNGAGFAHMPWNADVVIGEGFNDPERVRLADLDADGRAELMIIRENGQVQAWHNGRGFVYMPWDADVIIAEGFDPARTLLQ
ncbi:phage tail tip lysozyme [Pendulispora brunnea]|uniref:Phage tail tip lysozyme n=1 Tax=Pendulispora brunnea TaxID=2905690 RepID=A0ABZ2KF91_9BACT